METRASNVVISPAGHDECEEMARLEFASFGADKTSIVGPLMFPPNVSDEIQEQRVQTRAKGLRETTKAGKRHLLTAKIDGRIAGWAEWVPPGEDSSEPPQFEGFMGRFMSQVFKTRREAVGGTRYWYLALLVVDPGIQRRGVGQKLVQWGLDKSQQDPLGASDAFLESSLMAEPLYGKLGFEVVGWDSIPEEKAPGGVVRWPYMLRRVTPSSITAN